MPFLLPALALVAGGVAGPKLPSLPPSSVHPVAFPASGGPTIGQIGSDGFDPLVDPPPSGDPIWKQAQGASILLVRTGRPSLDDALEAGFQQHWRNARWTWIQDSLLNRKRPDSTVLVLKFVGINSLFRPDVWTSNCPTGWTLIGKVCAAQDSGSIALMALVRPDGDYRILYHILTELPSQRAAAGMAVDLVRDFHDAVTPQWRDTIPDPSLLSNTSDWQNLSSYALHSRDCPTCTLFVARESGVRLSAERIATETGHPVQVVGLDDIDHMLGTSRHGLYLESGGRSRAFCSARIRDLSDGTLRAGLEGMRSRPEELDSRQLRLDGGSVTILGHRLRGEESRPVFQLGYEFLVAGDAYSSMGIGGYEVRRGLLGLAGAGRTWTTFLDGLDEGVWEVAAGVRWLPGLGLESKSYSCRLYLSLLALHPIGQRVAYGGIRWTTPTLIAGMATIHTFMIDIGIGAAFPVTSPFGSYQPSQSIRPLCVQVGWSFMAPGWRESPSIWKDRSP